MRYILCLVLLCLIGCWTTDNGNRYCSIGKKCSTVDGTDIEYSRGFYNAMAIFYSNEEVLEVLRKLDAYPDWKMCHRSYETNADLYNYWDSSYALRKEEPKILVQENSGMCFYGWPLVPRNGVVYISNSALILVGKDTLKVYNGGMVWSKKIIDSQVNVFLQKKIFHK